MAKKVLSLGAIAMDVVLNSQGLPEDDGFSVIRKEEVLPGGSASNVSVACASLGMEAYQAGQIGDDEIGAEFRRTLKADHVDDRYVVTKKDGTTLHTYIITAPGGKHCIFANVGDAVGTLDPAALPEDIMDSMDLFYTDMFSGKAALWLMEKALKQGKPVVYNMQCVPAFMEMCGTPREELEQMLRHCTVFISGREGYQELTGESDAHKAMKLVQEKYQMEQGAILTVGDQGAYWYDGSEEYHVPAYRVDPVDTTGAGDCFIGGLLYAYFEEQKDKAYALRFASATAAVKCTVAGPRSRASVQDVLDLMETHH